MSTKNIYESIFKIIQENILAYIYNIYLPFRFIWPLVRHVIVPHGFEVMDNGHLPQTASPDKVWQANFNQRQFVKHKNSQDIIHPLKLTARP